MKKHFIFLGAAGVIYYSWLLALIFVAFIVGYESNKAISYPALSLGAIFVCSGEAFEKIVDYISFLFPCLKNSLS